VAEDSEDEHDQEQNPEQVTHEISAAKKEEKKEHQQYQQHHNLFSLSPHHAEDLISVYRSTA
jgi:hypothetical protein